MSGIKTNSGLVAYAKAQLGLPYWYGTFGQTATERLHKSKARQYARTGYYTKWQDYPSQYGKRVHDCVGLIKGYVWSATPTSVPRYNALQDKSASGMYRASSIKGTISTFPKKIGQLVYKSSSKTSLSQIHHVGVYIGDGFVIEAKGHEEGVVKTEFEGAGWTHWSQCPYITDDSEPEKAEKRAYSADLEGAYTVTCRSLHFRSGPGTTYKNLKILHKGDFVLGTGCFAKSGSSEWLNVTININGKTIRGWTSAKYLKKI